MRSISIHLPFVACLFAIAVPTFASDGVLEISQTCALSTGCFSSDASGFPVTISQSGSYVLTSNLDVTGQANPGNVTAVDVNASYVKIDLNGFSIIGPGTTGSGMGIDASFSNGVTVLNGQIRGMGSNGVRTDRRGHIEGLLVENNGGDGIFADIYSVVKDNRVFSNAGFGIDAGGSTIQGNVCYNNTKSGINGNNGSSIEGNAVNFNTADGIEVRFGSLLRGNAIRGNGGFGMNNTSGVSGYTENVFEGNGSGSVSGGVQIGENLCGAVVCP